MAPLRNKLVLLVAALTAAFALALPALATAAGEPNISLVKQAPETALLGSKQKVNLKASNPTGQPRGYNLTFRDVLPKGVKYVAGSAPEAPRVIENAPEAGKTTLIFENVADLSANSEYNLPYEIEAEPTAYTVGGKFKNVAEAFVSRKPRNKPSFNSKGEVEAGYTGSDKAEATTELSAIEIVKSEPSPEGEILRGLHRQQTVYTLTVKNNNLKPTKEISVEDYVPAGLEYLACDEADHTTNAKGTNPGSKEEYAGAGPINAEGNLPPAKSREACLKPTEVETEEVDPPGPQPKGVYTHVVWKGLGELAAGAERKIQYIAAVPIRRNALFSGTKPSATSLEQDANLDNNTGPETVDEEALTNVARAKGTFVGGPKAEEQIPVADTDEMTRTAEDLAVQKSVDKPTISEGQISTWTMKIESSEYRFVNNVRVDDVLPNGLCPLGKVNYEKPIQLLAECNPTGNEPSAEYTNVEEQKNGTFKIHWDQSTDPELAQLPPSTTVEIKFPTRTRTFYQENFENAKPILTNDSWANIVDIAGEDFARCAPNDPTCTKGQPKIFTQEEEGGDDFDHSEAGQQAGGVTIDKTVRDNDFKVVPTNCSGTYVDGTAATKIPKYRPGDRICWELMVDFASDLYSGTPAVTDFLPPNEKYVTGSAQPVTGVNTVESKFDESEAEGGSLEWTLGQSVESGNKVFAWRFQTEMQKTLAAPSSPKEITGNLMKFTYSNTAGKTFPLRDRAEIERIEPKLKLDKRVTSAGSGSINAEGNAIGSKGGENVKYSIAVTNEGNFAAKAIETWDVLPTGLKCEAVVSGSISDGGTCAAGTSTIKWTGLSLAVGETHSLTYEMTIPSNVAPAQKYENVAGVTQYQSETNKPGGEPFSYYPSANIAGETFEKEHAPNVASVKDTAFVSTADVTLSKTRETTVEQAGNNKPTQATIGEVVKYTITTVVPAGSELYGSPTVKDPLGTRLALVAGSVKGSVNGVAIPTAGVEAVEEGGNPVLKFPATYSNAPGSGDDTIKIEFEAKVTDVATNARSVGEGKLTNEAKLAFNDQNGVAKSKSSTITTTLVEPVIGVAKTNAGGNLVEPGQVVEYDVVVSNAPEAAGRVSTANETTVVDVIPAGMTPVNGTTPVEDGKKVEPSGGVWNEAARTITWTVAEIVPGASKELRYFAQVNKPANAGSTFLNTVNAKTTSLPGSVAGERTAASASHAGYEAAAEDEVKLNEAELQKEVKAPKGQSIGDPLEYTLRLKLRPQVAYFDTTVEDHLPKGVVYDGTASIKCEPGCEGIATGAKTLKPSSEEGSPLLGWYFGSIPAGEAQRTITIVYNAHIAQELEAGKKVVDKNVLTNKAIGLYNGSTKIAPPTEPPPRSSFSNKTGEPSTGTEVLEPHLTIKKSVTGATEAPKTQPGDQLVYTIEVKNTGDSSAYDMVVEDSNPNPAGGLGAVDPSTGEGSEFLAPKAGKPLRWVIPGPIKAGATQKLTYKATLKESKELTNGEAVPNTANIPTYFGAPQAQREAEGPAGRFREYTENPQSSVALEVALPKLQLNKTTGPSGKEEEAALIGEPFEWRLEVKNTAPVASLKNVNLLDTLPKGWEYVEGSAVVAPGGAKPTATVTTNGAGEQEIAWQKVANLAHGESATLSFKAIPTTALVGKKGVYTNTATATGEDASGSSKSAEGPYASTDTAKANLKTPPLTIVKKPDAGEGAAKAVAGKPSAYTIKVTNNGEATANAVKVTDLLDLGNGYTAKTATANPTTGFSETAAPETVEVEPGVQKTKLQWEIAEIGAGKSVTITVPVSLASNLPDPTVLHDVASVVSRQQPTPESDEGTLEVSREADMTIVKTEISGTVIPGEEVEYNLQVKNLGPSDAQGVKVVDPIPAGTEFVTADEPCALAGNQVACTIGELAAGKERNYKVKLKVLSSRTAPIVNKATVSTSTKEPEGGGKPNESTVESTVEPRAFLTVVKRAAAPTVLLGSTFEYELEVTNSGPSDAEEVTVTDPLPAEEEFVEAEAPCEEAEVEPPTVTCLIPSIPAGAAPVKLHFKVKAIAIPAEGAKVANVAEVTSKTKDINPQNTGTEETTVLPAADLAITKTAPATVEPDSDLTYGLRVENHEGPSIAHGVTVTDPLPAGVVFVSATEGCAFASGVVTCTVPPAGELAVGAIHEFQVTVHVPNALGGQSLVNTAEVTGEEGDPNTENDLSTVTTIVGPAADLSIVKTMGKAEAGKPLTYTLAIGNKGPSASSAVTVKDTLPAGTTFRSATPSQGNCSASGQDVTCALGALASGGSAQVSITVDVGATVTGTLRNAAKVEGPEPDPDKTNNESSVEGPVTSLPPASAPLAPSSPNLRVVKTASTASPQVGTPFDYQVTVTNMGGAEAKNVKVVDTLNGPVKVLSIESDSGRCTAAGSRIDCTIPSVPVGKIVHIDYSVIAEAAGPLSNTASAQAANGETAPANNRAVKSVKAKAAKAANASFTLTKTAAKKVVRGGAKVAFTITLRNGPTALVNATVCDRLPAALVFVKAAGASFVNGEACWKKKYVAAHKVLKLHLTARAVRGFKPRKARNVASASAQNAPGAKHASATVRIKPAFAGAPGGVTG